MTVVSIHYTRLPDRLSVFRQQLVHCDESCIVTLNPATSLPKPVTAGDTMILEPGAPAVWFTFTGLWHDIGRFHRADGTFTGYYANILTPVRFDSPTDIVTTDLCLDVWLAADGSVQILDEDEFEHAVASGWMTNDVAARAREEVEAITAAARKGSWPPAIVEQWSLEAALSVWK